MLFYRVLIKVSKGQTLMIRMWTLRLGGHTIAYGMLLYKSFLILFFIVRRHKDLFFRKIFVGKSNFCTVTLNLYLLFWCEDVTICLIQILMHRLNHGISICPLFGPWNWRTFFLLLSLFQKHLEPTFPGIRVWLLIFLGSFSPLFFLFWIFVNLSFQNLFTHLDSSVKPKLCL